MRRLSACPASSTGGVAAHSRSSISSWSRSATLEAPPPFRAVTTVLAVGELPAPVRGLMRLASKVMTTTAYRL